jgi:hypothetical protein
MRHFGQHRDAEIISSQPGLGPVLGARVLAEFGDDPDRYTDAKSRKSYAGASPITRASGKKEVVVARFVQPEMRPYRSRNCRPLRIKVQEIGYGGVGGPVRTQRPHHREGERLCQTYFRVGKSGQAGHDFSSPQRR